MVFHKTAAKCLLKNVIILKCKTGSVFIVVDSNRRNKSELWQVVSSENKFHRGGDVEQFVYYFYDSDIVRQWN